MASNVIKARMLETMGEPVVLKRSTQFALKQGGEIVTEARGAAERIVAEARRTAKDVFDTAKREGYENGAAEWHKALAAAWKSRDDYMAANEAALLKLAVRIAEKLVGQELRTAPETVAAIVREALRSVRRAKNFSIQVHPADAALLHQNIPLLRDAVGPTREIEIVSNPSLSRGDCVIESDIGVIEARLDTQLKNIERMLTAKASS